MNLSTKHLGLLLAACLVLAPARGWAVGEEQDGFPSWSERVIHEWMNRARCDPQVEMAKCGGACAEGACYMPVPPLSWDVRLNHAARFHAAEMEKQGYFDHNSHCVLVSNIDTLYPNACDGSVATACMPNTTTCDPSYTCTTNCCTAWSTRVSAFGAFPSGEIIAGGSDPDGAFYLWLFESSPSTVCGYAQSNGHRWNILTSGAPGDTGLVGAGVESASVGDFGNGGTSAAKIPSGSHYPRQGDTVEAWANWYDAHAPTLAAVDVDGTCTPLTRKRGSDTNGAFSATLSNVGSGCHRYYFVFKDAGGATVTYPTSGSLGIGPEGSCADWNGTRPALGAGCSCAPSCDGKSCGDDGCGGLCGGVACAVTDGGTTATDGAVADGATRAPVPDAADGASPMPEGGGCSVLAGRSADATSTLALALALGVVAWAARRPRRRG